MNYMSYHAIEELNHKVCWLLQEAGIVGLKPVIELECSALAPDSICVRVLFLKEARGYKFVIENLMLQLHELALRISKEIIEWIDAKYIYKDAPCNPLNS